jgi:hypothetical protein
MLYGNALHPKAVPYTAPKGSSVQNSVLVAVYRGEAELSDLRAFFKHYEHRNVVVVESSRYFSRGAMVNAAVDFVLKNTPELTHFVVLDLRAKFKTEFAKKYFEGAEDVVDLGSGLDMPFGWAMRFTKASFKVVNGFPNTFGRDEVGEAEALRERVYWNRKKLALFLPDEQEPLFGPVPEKPRMSRGDTTKSNVLLDRIHWRLDGLNTVQYKVTEHRVGDWANETPTNAVNLRTLTVQFFPDPSDPISEPSKGDEKTEAKAKPHTETPATVGGTSKEEAKAEEADAKTSQEPSPVHVEQPTILTEIEKTPVVEIIIDPPKKTESEPLPLLENDKVYVPSTNNVKVIKYDGK